MNLYIKQYNLSIYEYNQIYIEFDNYFTIIQTYLIEHSKFLTMILYCQLSN